MDVINVHGNKGLTNQEISLTELECLAKDITKLPKLYLPYVAEADLLCLATGIFSPLHGFMGKDDYLSVTREMRLKDGTLWPVPITLPVPLEKEALIKNANYALLINKAQEACAIIRIEELYFVDLEEEAQSVFGTTSLQHPGVARLKEHANLYVAGKIWLFQRPTYLTNVNFAADFLDPKQTRALFKTKGYHSIVGFQTRNPVHRAHEYIQKVALETHDALFLNPLVGPTKADDISAEVRMKSYKTLLDGYYPKERVVLGVFPAAMRYAGPKEALLHAIARQNYGCTHLIVGRDHAGVYDFYDTYAAQAIFSTLQKNDLQIQPLMFEHTFYCQKCSAMASAKTCPHPKNDHLQFSGTKVRELLAQGASLPIEFARPEVVAVLRQEYQ